MPWNFFVVWRLRSLPTLGIFAAAIIAIMAWHAWGAGLYPADYAISWALAGKTVVIDAGHGGKDPGVIGTNGTLEKDINLAIAKELKALLEQSGATVIMTRADDRALGENKRGDLVQRVELVKSSKATLCISIHGNAFPRMRSSHGAQTFFAGHIEQSRILAESIQGQLRLILNNTDRQALQHKTAYILKNIDVPAVVVEVGFLSNEEEEHLLNEKAYQWKVAWAIFSGMAEYYALEEEKGLSDQNNASEVSVGY